MKAPAAGRRAALGISSGPYLAADTPYARLTLLRSALVTAATLCRSW